MTKKVLARNWSFKVGAVAIKGITEFGLSPTKNDVDSTDFDSNGWEEHIVASRGLTIELTGYYLEGEDGVRDAGQQAVDNLGMAVGADSIGTFTMTSPNGKVWTFSGTVESTSPSGGGTDDNTGWEVSIRVTGKPTIV